MRPPTPVSNRTELGTTIPLRPCLLFSIRAITDWMKSQAVSAVRYCEGKLAATDDSSSPPNGGFVTTTSTPSRLTSASE